MPTRQKSIPTFILLFLTYSIFIPLNSRAGDNLIIDFTKKQDNLFIVTDSTEREQGLSNASIDYQNSHYNKSHFFYVHLEPQPNGAAFAGFKLRKMFNLSDYYQINLSLRKLTKGVGQFQIVITTKDSELSDFSYKSDFIIDNDNHQKITALLDNFTATRRGSFYPNAPKLDKLNITSIGIRLVGRVAKDICQKGVYALQLKSMSFGIKKM